MKLKEFTVKLNCLMRNNPKAKELEVVSASDTEGNSFDIVYFDPTVGKFNAETGEFEFEDCIDDANAVCIN